MVKIYAFLALMAFFSALKAQTINNEVIANIKNLTDSIYTIEIFESAIYSKHLCFYIKTKRSRNDEVKIAIEKIFNYFELRFLDYNYISVNEKYHTLYLIDSTINVDEEVSMIRPIKNSDNLILRNKLLDSDSAFILYHGVPSTYKLTFNNKLELNDEHISINNNEFYKLPKKITIDKWK